MLCFFSSRNLPWYPCEFYRISIVSFELYICIFDVSMKAYRIESSILVPNKILRNNPGPAAYQQPPFLKAADHSWCANNISDMMTISFAECQMTSLGAVVHPTAVAAVRGFNSTSEFFRTMRIIYRAILGDGVVYCSTEAYKYTFYYT